MGQQLIKEKDDVNDKLFKVKNKIYLDQPINHVVRTISKYKSTGIGDISFDENELLLILSKFNDFWLVAKKLKDNKRGLVPSHYLVRYDRGPTTMDAWRNVQRAEAKQLLMNPILKRGTYIIRPSSKMNCYALSVRDIDKSKSTYTVKHFLIKSIPKKSGQAYCTNVRVYPDFITLIQYFEKYGIGTSRTKLRDKVPDDIDEKLKENIDRAFSLKYERDDSAMTGCVSVSKLRLKKEIRNILDIFAGGRHN